MVPVTSWELMNAPLGLNTTISREVVPTLEPPLTCEGKVPVPALYSLFTERLSFLKHNKGPVALVSEKSFEDINELLEKEM
ncbi:hypothetical protein EYF80_054079 [Liparis tanakae]|uniref:Uncharacterized protein n=1 Tax=Liparis tanakae TaxID=230148 RepID=A0A4Z2F4S7_9TELE|nr:hypothetical protein EYF80_054079 [Liparis tanakae]